MGRAGFSRRRIVGAAFAGGLLFSLALATACSDDGDSTPTATLPASEAGTAAPTQALTPTPESALPLDRYHYAASLTLRETKAGAPREVVISTEGDYQAPDRHAFTHAIRSDGQAYARSTVIMGERAWLRQAQGPWQPIGRGDGRLTALASAAFSPLRPDFLGGDHFADVRKDVRRLPSTPEAVNGVRANHYRIDAAGREFLQTFLPEKPVEAGAQNLAWDLWLAEDGDWPVRLTASGSITGGSPALDELHLEAPLTWTLRIEVSRPNDPALVIAAP